MKPNRPIVFIVLAVVAIAGAWSAREERRSPCASGACRLPLLPTDNTMADGGASGGFLHERNAAADDK